MAPDNLLSLSPGIQFGQGEAYDLNVIVQGIGG